MRHDRARARPSIVVRLLGIALIVTLVASCRGRSPICLRPCGHASRALPESATALPSGTPAGVEGVRASRLRVIEKVIASGPSSEPWTNGADRLVQSWRRSLAREDTIRFQIQGTGCYRDGCVFDVSATNLGVWQTAADSFVRSSEFRLWKGGKFLSGPEIHEAGDVVGAWVLLRPSQEGTR